MNDISDAYTQSVILVFGYAAWSTIILDVRTLVNIVASFFKITVVYVPL